ncbi:2846_t:CDS:2 [Cetraspora pellucida]|uniref:2846_t:CDS:1 n=1 Tax=Cetraspora pellucida TaxID=1433469 RepID=A0ACA9KF51_9GLOM|nr:2846_t:CDS:2 [Cetraspora pellucida]
MFPCGYRPDNHRSLLSYMVILVESLENGAKIDNIMNEIELKITNLLRKEKFHLKKKDTGLLNNDKKLEEEIKKNILSFAQTLILGLRFQLRPKICQKECYDSSNLIIKREIDFQHLDYNGLIGLLKEVDLPKDKNLQIVFAEISSPLITYHIDDLFCQEKQNRLFLNARVLYSVAEVKGRLIGIANAKPIKFETPHLDKCQTCQKPLLKEKAMGGKKVEFSDACYYFCSKGCIRDYERWEALERGENIEDYLKREQEKEILTQHAIKELDERNKNSNNFGSESGEN